MAEPFTIRPMTPADIDAVMTIAADLPGAPHWPRSSYEAIFAPGSSPQHIAIVAHTSALDIVGFAIASVLPPQAELESIAVPSHFQRQGLAGRLFTALQASLRAHNCSQILLEVRQSNHAALALYRALGFSQTALRPAYYSNPVEDAILMARSI
jgi:[ribosomal protein S18]-alanine N-acetyltransferase